MLELDGKMLIPFYCSVSVSIPRGPLALHFYSASNAEHFAGGSSCWTLIRGAACCTIACLERWRVWTYVAHAVLEAMCSAGRGTLFHGQELAGGGWVSLSSIGYKGTGVWRFD
jgi:hypothetical protein